MKKLIISTLFLSAPISYALAGDYFILDKSTVALYFYLPDFFPIFLIIVSAIAGTWIIYKIIKTVNPS